MQLQVTYKQIWRLAYPIIISSFAQSMLNIIDTAFLGRVGEVELGASVIAGIWYFTMVIAFAWALSSGTQIIISRRIGEQKEGETGIIFDNSLYLLFFVSIACFIFLRFVTHPLFQWSISNVQIREAALQFSDTRSYGIFFVMFSMSFRAFAISIARTRIITYSMLLMAAVNTILAYAFIFGKLGSPVMGIRGAALASVIAEATALLFFVIHVLTRIDIKKYNLFRFRLHGESIGKILVVGAPVAFQYFISMVGWFLFFIFIEKIGKHQLAISNIVRSAYMLGMTPIWGLAAAASTITSNIIGQGKHDDVFIAMKNVCYLSFLIIGVLALINFFMPSIILSVFTSDPALIHDAHGCMMVMAVSMLFFFVGFVLITMVSGTGATYISLLIESFAIFIYVLYIYFVVVIFKMQVESVWVSEVIYWMLMAALAYRYLKSRKWEGIKV